jgi:hypothetical protein
VREVEDVLEGPIVVPTCGEFVHKIEVCEVEEKTMTRNKVFISYPSEDGIIADSVSAAITKMPGNGLELFLDRIYIKGGARIPDTIRDALKQTVYFVAVGTDVKRRNFDWCGQELGFYQASTQTMID